jgi:excisionase family DNA binding protein
MDIESEWFPLTELRKRFGPSRSTGNRLIAIGAITAAKVGRSVLLNTASVRRYLASQPRPQIQMDAKAARLGRRSGVDQIASDPSDGRDP